jgi:hypothetical protein
MLSYGGQKTIGGLCCAAAEDDQFRREDVGRADDQPAEVLCPALQLIHAERILLVDTADNSGEVHGSRV